MTSHLQIAAIVASVLMLLGVLELVRRRHLLERYALLWLLSAGVLLLLAVWTNLLTIVSHAIGIKTPSNALFAVAFAFVLALLMHFSLTISRLTDQNKMLAQTVGLLSSELREARGEAAADDVSDPDA